MRGRIHQVRRMSLCKPQHMDTEGIDSVEAQDAVVYSQTKSCHKVSRALGSSLISISRKKIPDKRLAFRCHMSGSRIGSRITHDLCGHAR
jgi:hypothetical protein